MELLLIFCIYALPMFAMIAVLFAGPDFFFWLAEHFYLVLFSILIYMMLVRIIAHRN
ncbi:hypothetical protein [Paenibacillus thiaminolyticus]|uniref:hypothetical protein n=1 Tax=Paenibacillus thiaminolyticus TaxID=49283 RepID=UPI001603D16C|nr:hypothetical protein [Paenibacillus thiaminolyticus]